METTPGGWGCVKETEKDKGGREKRRKGQREGRGGVDRLFIITCMCANNM